jgi:hypothetical protein
VTPLTARPIVLHEDVLAEILSNLQPIDFRAKAGLDENEKIAPTRAGNERMNPKTAGVGEK